MRMLCYKLTRTGQGNVPMENEIKRCLNRNIFSKNGSIVLEEYQEY